MICAKVSIRPGWAKLEMQGHADYNPGNDIVCAGCSAVVYALAGWLENSVGRLNSAPIIRLESGDATIQAAGQVEEAFRQALCGLLGIEASHPEHVQVKII